ncbi:larval cuticle protein 9-like [Armigeres subalbatus]|uniref:larval cuticle protein 9-like n=1 Tax=Armigeres subalbatus TaxID=124917 RepID=UPI002ED234E3
MDQTCFVAVILTFLLCLVHPAAPEVKEADSNNLKVVSESNNYATNEFDWSYGLDDGREVRSNAYKKQLTDGREILVITGLYSYIASNGVKYTITYYSDENGYHPTVVVGDKPSYTVELQHIDSRLLASLVG